MSSDAQPMCQTHLAHDIWGPLEIATVPSCSLELLYVYDIDSEVEYVCVLVVELLSSDRVSSSSGVLAISSNSALFLDT